MDPHDVLGVTPESSWDEVRSAYKRLVRIHHPDRHVLASPQDQATHARRAAEVSGAWRLLNDPVGMARHRANRARGVPSPVGQKPVGQKPVGEKPVGGKPVGEKDVPPPAMDDVSDAPAQREEFDYRRVAASEFTTARTTRASRRQNSPRPRSSPRPAHGRRRARRAQKTRRRGRSTGWVILLLLTVGGLVWLTQTPFGLDFRRSVATSLGSGPTNADPGVFGSSDGLVPGDGTVVLGEANDRTGSSQLIVGSCFDSTVRPDGTGGGDVVDIDLLSCTQPHPKEAIEILAIPGGRLDPYPGREQISDQASPSCRDAFEVVTGRELFAGDELTMSFILPSPESWRAGDRRLVCEIRRADGQPLIGSIAAADD